jgi:hypothetical protein
MVANANTKGNNPKRITVGGKVGGNAGGNAGGKTKSNVNNNAGQTRRDNSISLIFNGDTGMNQIVYVKQFMSKRSGTQMLKFIVYDFNKNVKYSFTKPLYYVLKVAYPNLDVGDDQITIIGQLTPKTQPNSTTNGQ